jgi:D-xylose ABC transporter substrate-binding protein
MKSAFVKLVLAGMFCMLSTSAISQKVGLLLGSFVSDRWYLDQKLFADRITELGGECLIEIGYDAQEQLVLADKLLKSGVNVLVVVALDGVKASPIVTMAAERDVPVVCYDRLILNNDVSIYVSFDNEKVGRMQAEYMVSRFPTGKYMLINGPTTDHNAVLFRKGQLDVLRPLLDSGRITLVHDHILQSWSAINAFEFSNDYFNSDKEKPDVILAANDAIANGILQALPPENKGKIAITGQDADLNGIRNIIGGHQSMTVYKPIRKLANTAAEVAMTLATGKHVKGNEMITAGTVSVKAILLEPIIVDNFNYKETVVKDGHVSLSEVVKNLGKAFEAERNRIQLALLLKEKALEVEQKKNQRQIFLVVLVFLGLMLAALSFTIYQKHRNNRLLNIQKQVIEKKNEELQKINAQLQVLNEELRGQKEQISHQRDAITRQKEELISVNEIIAAQKDAIQYQNESLEKEVHKRTTELIQYIRQLEQYSFVTAHNLRAPVARIIGLAELVKMHQDRPEEARFMIGKLVESSQELDLVFRELNSILDIRTFSMEIFSQVNLEEELSNIKGNLQTEIQQNEAIIQNNFDSVATLFSIKPYIHSILFNLISNAIKYRDPARPPVIRIHTEKLTDNRVLLSVADNGLGIDMLYVDKVFQLYKRFHFHVEGRGIGLFLVKTQVDSLGGKIEIESEVNKGTTINIYLQQSHTNGKH